MRNEDTAQPSFHSQLESLLAEQLRAQPRNHGLRLKLLELYYETRQVNPFIREAKSLAEATLDRANSPEWQKCLSMGRMLAPEAAVFADQSTGERIEFVGSEPGQLAGKPAPKVRRFGDDQRFVKLFEALAADFKKTWADQGFQARLDLELACLARRPSAMIHARRLSEARRGAQIYLKREDVSPRDTHLIITVVGQALLAQRLGRKTLVTGSTDGRRGVITASIAARLGLKAVVFMDAEASALHSANAFRMWLLGADLRPTADLGAGRSEDAREAALQFWARDPDHTLMIVGLEGAPQPYPAILREFTATIGRESQRQLRVMAKRSPDLLVARGGNNADALGLFPPFLADAHTRLVCVEPAPAAATPGAAGAPSLDPLKLPLSRSEQKLAQTILEGLEYPSVGREHAWFQASGRVEYVKASEEQAKKAIRDLASYEGIVPAIETAHALGWACDAAAAMSSDQVVAVVIAEDVDKSIWDVGRLMGAPL